MKEHERLCSAELSIFFQQALELTEPLTNTAVNETESCTKSEGAWRDFCFLQMCLVEVVFSKFTSKIQYCFHFSVFLNICWDTPKSY